MPSWVAILISAAVPVIIALVTGAVAWGWFKNKVEAQDKAIKDLHSSLFQTDNTLVYVPAADCEKRRDDCDKNHSRALATVCGKIDKFSDEFKLVNEWLHKIELVLARVANGKGIKEVK